MSYEWGDSGEPFRYGRFLLVFWILMIFLGWAIGAWAQGSFTAPSAVSVSGTGPYTCGPYSATDIYENGNEYWWSWTNSSGAMLLRHYWPNSYGTGWRYGSSEGSLDWVSGWGPGDHPGDVADLPSGVAVWVLEGPVDTTTVLRVMADTNGTWQYVISNGVGGVERQLVQIQLVLTNIGGGLMDTSSGETLLTVLRDLLTSTAGAGGSTNLPESLAASMKRVADEQNRMHASINSNAAVMDKILSDAHADWAARGMLADSVSSGKSISQALDAHAKQDSEHGMSAQNPYDPGFSTAESLGRWADAEKRDGMVAVDGEGKSRAEVTVRELMSIDEKLDNLRVTVDQGLDGALTVSGEVQAHLTDPVTINWGNLDDLPGIPDDESTNDLPQVTSNDLHVVQIENLEESISNALQQQFSDINVVTDKLSAVEVKFDDVTESVASNTVPFAELMEEEPDGEDVTIATVLFRRNGGSEVPVKIGWGTLERRPSFLADILNMVVVYLYWAWGRRIYSIYTGTGGME